MDTQPTHPPHSARRVKFDQAWRAWHDCPDGARRQRLMDGLIRDNMPLISKFIMRIMKRSAVHVEHDDAMQAGMIGMMTALRKYDPARPTAFSTMAWPWVRHEVQSAMLHQTQMYRPKGAGMPYAEHNLSESIEAREGREATPEELGTTQATLDKWRSLVWHFVPMDDAAKRDRGDDSISATVKMLPDGSPLADEVLEKSQELDTLHRAMRKLSARERALLLSEDNQGLTKAVANDLRRSAIERLQQIIASA